MYPKTRDDPEDRESQRKKEVDDLISKYSHKKSKPKLGIIPSNREVNDYSSVRYGQANTDRTYGGSSNTFSGRRSSQYDSITKALPSSSTGTNYDIQAPGKIDSSLNKYGTTDYRRGSINSNASNDYKISSNTYNDKYDKYSNVGGYGVVGSTGMGALQSSASSANISYAPTASAAPPSAARRYLAQSKSSSNLFLYPQSNTLSSTLNSQQDLSKRTPLTRQQKTLSIHGLPGSGASPLVSRGGGLLPSGGSSSALFANLKTNQDDFYLEGDSGLENSNQPDWRKKPLWKNPYGGQNIVSKGAAPIIAPPPIMPVQYISRSVLLHSVVWSVQISVNL